MEDRIRPAADYNKKKIRRNTEFTSQEEKAGSINLSDELE